MTGLRDLKAPLAVSSIFFQKQSRSGKDSRIRMGILATFLTLSPPKPPHRIKLSGHFALLKEYLRGYTILIKNWLVYKYLAGI
jgi:hypothetical protein